MCVFLDRNSNHLAIDIILQVCLVLKQIDLTEHLWEYQTSEYKQESCFRLEQGSASGSSKALLRLHVWLWETAGAEVCDQLQFYYLFFVWLSQILINGLHVEFWPSRRYYRELLCVSIGGCCEDTEKDVWVYMEWKP